MKPTSLGASGRPRRGEVWWVDFSPSIGNEIRDEHPALAISTDHLNESSFGVLIVIPISSSSLPFRIHIDVPVRRSRPFETESHQVRPDLARRTSAVSGRAEGSAQCVQRQWPKSKRSSADCWSYKSPGTQISNRPAQPKRNRSSAASGASERHECRCARYPPRSSCGWHLPRRWRGGRASRFTWFS